MDVVKNKLNSMKAQSELSEEKIMTFESALRTSKQHLEAALKEKELLQRKIEAVETQIINADRQRADIIDRIKQVEQDTDSSESRRKVLENRELQGDEALVKLEVRLKSMQERYSENSVRCEDGERRLAVLRSEYEKLRSRRLQKEKEAAKLELEIEEKLKKLRLHEEIESNAAVSEYKHEDHMKLLESYYQEAEEKKELGRLNILRLRRLIEKTQDQIESVNMQTRSAKVDMKNTIQIVADN